MKIILHYSNNPPFIPGDHATKGLGGTENFILYVAEELERLGHNVSLFNQSHVSETINGIKVSHVDDYDSSEEADILISFRMREVFQYPNAAKQRVLILADTESVGLGEDVRAGRITSVVSVSQWQQDKIAEEEDLVGNPCWINGSNGINAEEFEQTAEKKTGYCVHLSTPERALALLINLWPIIEDHITLKEAGIKPELHLFSSFKGWGVNDDQNNGMVGDVYHKITELITQGYNIYNHVHVPPAELREYQKRADLMLYPTNFDETYCISLTECMAAGALPVISNRAAPAERIITGENGWLVGSYHSDAYTLVNRSRFVRQVVRAMALPQDQKNKMREAAVKTAMNDSYTRVVASLMKELEKRTS